MNIRTTKIVAPLVAMALCTPNIAFAQEESNQKTIISRSTDVNEDFTLTRSISAINRDNSTPQDPYTIYVNPGDTINVTLDLKRKTGKRDHGFTSFKEVVSPIQESSAISGSLTVYKSHLSNPLVRALNELPNNETFKKTSESTIEFNAKPPTYFGDLGKQVTIKYSYKAGNKLGPHKTQFLPRSNFASPPFDGNELNLTIVVKNKEEDRPTPPDQGGQDTPPDQGGQDTPPDQGGQDTPPESNRSTVFSLLTKALGVLAFLGGTVWFIIKHIFRL
ncbi:membrane protein [Corynebacterium diphtheriae]|nr:membrane protein [Corynebacterium diphtheriae]CAB1024429.1 membrane protein [Corynebacterium diphtheriae]